MLNIFKKRKWQLLAVAIVIGILLLVRSRSTDDNKESTVISPEYRDIRQSLNVSGEVNAEEKATLAFPVSSRLSWVGVSEGEDVTKWQAIASVDTRTLHKQLQMDLNNFGKEFRDHDQTLDDNDYYDSYDFNLEIRRLLEKAQFDLDNTVLQVEIRDLAIRLSSLTSPIDGIVTRIDTPHSGVTVTPLNVFEIVNPDTVFFEVIIDEEDIGLVSVNQSAITVLDAFPDEEYNSAVQFIEFSPSVTEGGGTGYLVRLTLPVNNIDLKYKLGMNGEAELILDQKENVLSIPVDSLISRDSQNFVEVRRFEDIERIEVQTGISDGDYIEILSGLEPSDEVLIPTNGEE